MTDAFRIAEESLARFCIEALMASSVPEADARETTAVMIFADKRGIASHGCSILPGYMHHLRLGNINARPNARILADEAAYAIVDGDGGLGPVTAARCARIAIEKAARSATAFVAARNSNHFGAGSYYALIMSEAGMIGEAISNAPPVMAPTGSRERALGNNPYAVAAPTRGRPAFVFDIATSVVAGRKVIAAAQAEHAVPLGWLLDPLGNPSTDPRDFTRGGALVPFGGHKGYGLALAFEVFAGVLTGAGIGSETQGRTHEPAGGVGHVFRAVNVSAFMPLEAFHDRMDLLIDQMKAAGKAPGVSDVLIPGEMAHGNEMASNTLGVPLATETLKALTGLASTLGIDPPNAHTP